MSPEQLDKARASDAYVWASQQSTKTADEINVLAFERYRELVVSNWTPPDPISPRVMAAREWIKSNSSAENFQMLDDGDLDDFPGVAAFLAGFAAAVKLAHPVANMLSDIGASNALARVWAADIHQAITTYRQSTGDTPHEGQ